MKDVYTRYFSIYAHEADIYNRAFPRSISNWMQEAARQHADELGLGVETMISKKQTWLLTRQLTEINRLPHYGEKVKLTTWPKGFTGYFANRDFLLEDEDGNTLARATTSWVVLDLKTLRPTHEVELPDTFARNKDLHAIETSAEKVHAPVPSILLRKTRVLYSHLDVNKHVNNSQYLNYALDSLSPKTFSDYEVEQWNANFLAECKLGDELNIVADHEIHPKVIEVSTGDKPVFRLSVSWRKRKS